jgi:hypothetical protein
MADYSGKTGVFKGSESRHKAILKRPLYHCFYLYFVVQDSILAIAMVPAAAFYVESFQILEIQEKGNCRSTNQLNQIAAHADRNFVSVGKNAGPDFRWLVPRDRFRTADAYKNSYIGIESVLTC